MSEVVLFVPGPLPSLNEIIDAKANVFIPKGMAIPGRGITSARLPNEWANIKKRWHKIVDKCCIDQGFEMPANGGYMTFFCLEPTKRRDPDNVGSAAQKIIQDGLVARGSMLNDGWKFVAGYRHFFEIDKENPGVYLVVTQDRCLNELEATDFFASVLLRGVVKSAP